MSVIGRLCLISAAVFAFALTLLPYAVIGAHELRGLPAELGDPAIRTALGRQLKAASTIVAVAWPAGVLAALGLWGAATPLRRVVKGLAVAALLLSALPCHVRMAARAGGATALVMLILLAALARLDPRLLRSAAAAGATRSQSWRLVMLPALAGPLVLAAAAAFVLCFNQALIF